MDISDNPGFENDSRDTSINRGKRKHVYHRRHRHRRSPWKKLKKTLKPLLIVIGICFVTAILLTYITGGLPNLVEKVITKNIEKAIERTTAEFAEGELSTEKLKGLTKNIDINKLKGEAFKRLGGWEGDRGEGQSPEDFKKQEEYKKHLHDFEKNKEYYKEKYQDMIRK